MRNWKTEELGGLVKAGGGRIQTGPFGSQLHAADYVDEGIPCIMPTNMENNRVKLDGIARITEADAQRLKRHIVKTGDIVYSRRGDVTQKALIHPTEDGYFCGTGCLLLRPGDKIDPTCLTYYLSTKTYQNWIVSQAVGGTMPNLNTGILERISFTAPDKGTQKKIVKVLATLDAKIALNNRINAELEAMAKLLYDYWFVQFDFPMTAAQAAALGQPQLEGQPYKSSGGKMVFDPILKREIPEGWEAHTLEKALTLCYGKALKKEIQSPGPYPVYGSNGIYGYHDTPLVKGPGIIIGRKGTVGSVTWEHGDFFATDTSYYVETKAYYSMAYAFHLLKSLRLDLMNTDSAVPGLSRTYAYMRTFASPPAELVEAFTKIVAPLRDQIHINQKQNQELTTLRDWLLPMLMNGQVTVR